MLDILKDGCGGSGKGVLIIGMSPNFWPPARSLMRMCMTGCRGTPESPGRVVTLLRAGMTYYCAPSQCPNTNGYFLPFIWLLCLRPAPESSVFGIVYDIAAKDKDEILDQLYYREKAGYSEATVVVHCSDGVDREALVFMASEDNPHFLGEEHIDVIAAQVRTGWQSVRYTVPHFLSNNARGWVFVQRCCLRH